MGKKSMESERKSKTVAKRFLFLSSQDRKNQTSNDHFEDRLHLSFWGSHPKSAACAHSHTLSFSSHCQGAEGGGHMGFKCQEPLGLPLAHPLHSHLSPWQPTPLLAQALSWGEPVSAQGKWDPAGPVLYYLNPVVFHSHSSLPIGADQVPHIWVLADDSLPDWLSAYWGKAAEACLWMHVWERAPACQDFSSGSETGSRTKRAHQLPQAQLKERQPEEKGFLHTHCHSLYVASLIIFLFTLSPWRPVKRLYQALPSCSDKYAIISQHVYQDPC